MSSLKHKTKAQLIEKIEVSQREVKNLRVDNEKLKETEQKYRLLAENSSDVIWTTDLKLNTTYVSPAARRLFGCSVEKAMSEKLENKLASQSIAVARKTLKKELAAVSIIYCHIDIFS